MNKKSELADSLFCFSFLFCLIYPPPPVKLIFMFVYPDIKEYFDRTGVPSYRYRQLYHAITSEFINDFEEEATLPADLRVRLAAEFPSFFPKEVSRLDSPGCVKFLLRLGDGLEVETVLIENRRRGSDTVCFSTQIGCPLSCRFCATGEIGFKRQLRFDEIAAQVFFAARYLKENGRRVNSVVAMGMGEPFLNFENLVQALRLLNDGDGFNLAARHISVSTVGIIPGIRKFTRLPEQFNLAISLHSPFQRQRQELMPIAKKYPLKELLETARRYIESTHRKVMLEYVLLDEVNTSPVHMQALAAIARSGLFQVNLVNYNFACGDFRPVSPVRARELLESLQSMGASATLRRSVGGRIKAACGQLAGFSQEVG